MRVHAFGRSCRFFVRQAELLVCGAVAGSVFMAAYIWLINGESFAWQELLEYVPHAVISVSMIIMLMNGLSSYSFQYLYSVPVSFGCLRKHAFNGMLVMNGLIMAESLLLYWILTKLLHMGQAELPMSLALFLIVEGLSQLGGVILVKWGRAGTVCMIIVCVAVSASYGFAVSYAGMSGVILSVSAVFGKEMVRHWQWLALAAGAVVCLAANAVSWQFVKKWEVRA